MSFYEFHSLAADISSPKGGKSKDTKKPIATELSRSEFKEIMNMIEASVSLSEESPFENNNEEDDESMMIGDDITDEEADEAFSDEEITKELFEELRQGKDTVKVKDFMTWTEIEELKDAGYIDDDTIKIFLSEVGSKPNGSLTLDQFSQLVQMIDEAASAMEGGEEGVELNDDADDEEDIKMISASSAKGTTTNPKNDKKNKKEEKVSVVEEINENEDNEIELSEEEIAEVRELFDELKGKVST